jgi:uncharacterized RDD family membrane protein YckC
MPQAPAYTPIPDGPETPAGGWQQPPPSAQGWVGQPLASWGSRAGAAILDGLILLVPFILLVVIVVVVALSSDAGGIATGVLSFLLYLVVLLLYAPLLMARSGARNGQTLGKQMLGIRVVRNNGQPMDFAWSALREVVVKGLAVGVASSIIPLLPWLLDVLWPLWDGENRALHDLAVQTHVVRA